MIDIPSTYESSRERFRALPASFSKLGFDPVLTSIPLAQYPDLTIDVIRADATREKQKLFILTTGLHGIEGYIGAGVIQIFIEEYLPRFDPETTGVMVVHPINPHGMKHHQRFNPNGVDLNRNFVEDFERLKSVNPHYEALSFLINPRRPLKSPLYEKTVFFWNAFKALLKGVSYVRETTLMGQYRVGDGIYFGGFEAQEETRIMMKLYDEIIRDYAQILALDIHTGYGPRWQMSVMNPPSEAMTAREAESRFKVPLAAGVNPDEFYTIHGDICEYLHQRIKSKHPDKKFYVGGFEFGTYGDSIWQQLRSLRITVLEHALRRFGGSNEARDWVKRGYDELFLPADPKWREKAWHDARVAFEGIFEAEGFLQKELR